MLINAGVERVVYEGDYADQLSLEMLQQAGVELVRFSRQAAAPKGDETA
jgi:dCMP deaminase